MVSTGAGIVSIRCEAQHSELIGIIPEGRRCSLALSSFQDGMPNSVWLGEGGGDFSSSAQVQTTQRPVVLMNAPERKQNGQGQDNRPPTAEGHIAKGVGDLKVDEG